MKPKKIISFIFSAVVALLLAVISAHFLAREVWPTNRVELSFARQQQKFSSKISLRSRALVGKIGSELNLTQVTADEQGNGHEGELSQDRALLNDSTIRSSGRGRDDGSSGNSNSMARETDEHDLSSVLLTDSILSIIQSYYVDADRISNNNIIEFTLKSLHHDGRFLLKKKGTLYKLSSKRADYSIKVPAKIPYDAMLEIMVGLGRFLDVSTKRSESQVKLGDAETKEKGASIVLNGLLKGLDAHSALLSQESYRELRQGTEGTFGGLGVLVGIRNHLLTVIKPLPHSPAFRKGIKKHDKIISIDGVDTFGYSLDQLVEYMRGEPGSEVDLTLLRPGADSPEKLFMNREFIRVDSVTSHTHEAPTGPVLRLVIESFSSRTSKEVLMAILQFRRKHKGEIGGLILDLRSNPGGLLDQSVQVADLFLESGTIVSTRGRRQEVETASRGRDELNYPIVILVNGDSASASEIVAGALQDQGRALVIGQPSFGKGSVQTVFELPGQRALKLTIARYYTPSGRSIQNIGITPDIWIQPIYRQTSNSNLMGNYRYRNERFLQNHLSANNRGDFGRIFHQPTLGYHLMNLGTNGENVSMSADRDIELALTVIGKVNLTYGVKVPPGGSRASHWMALASSEVQEKMKTWNKEVSDYLKASFNLEWRETSALHRLPLTVSVPKTIPNKIEPGQTAEIPFKIENPSLQDANQVSIFVRANTYMIEPKEVLIGRIAGGKSHSGRVRIEMPTSIPPGHFKFEVGMAYAASLTNNPLKTVSFAIKSRKTPVLLPIVELVDEVGGTISGVLESNETATVSVVLKNDSAVPAKNLIVKLTNFSGSQVRIKNNELPIGIIPAGKSKTVEFLLLASSDLKTPSLGFGLSVEGTSLESTFTEKIEIPAIKSSSKVSSLIGH